MPGDDASSASFEMGGARYELVLKHEELMAGVLQGSVQVVGQSPPQANPQAARLTTRTHERAFMDGQLRQPILGCREADHVWLRQRATVHRIGE
ncbi:hypothetical protein GOP47_0026640 [Adiantum capillus-veneris]|nr:hypothetical protein GOP47_0026640 [Adiantum capillus-veneris]